MGIEAIAPPILDLGFFFALTLPDFRRVSNLLAKKLAVLAKILMSSAACSTLPLPEAFSIMGTSIFTSFQLHTSALPF